MFHMVESCPLAKLNGGLSRLHSADEDAVFVADQLLHDTNMRRLTHEVDNFHWGDSVVAELQNHIASL